MLLVIPPHLQILNLRCKILFFICCWLNPWMQNPRIQMANSMFIEKNLCISGLVQFKPMLFKGQLYIY